VYMSTNKETAVDYLYKIIQMGHHIGKADWDKAKQMEKEQIMKAVYDSMGTNFDPNWGRAELYYNETYGK